MDATGCLLRWHLKTTFFVKINPMGQNGHFLKGKLCCCGHIEKWWKYDFCEFHFFAQNCKICFKITFLYRESPCVLTLPQNGIWTFTQCGQPRSGWWGPQHPANPHPSDLPRGPHEGCYVPFEFVLNNHVFPKSTQLVQNGMFITGKCYCFGHFKQWWKYYADDFQCFFPEWQIKIWPRVKF